MFLTMFFKMQNTGQTMHLTMLIAHPYGASRRDYHRLAEPRTNAVNQLFSIKYDSNMEDHSSILESREGEMASRNKRDVVARLVSKKLRSRIILGSCSSSEEDSLDHEGKVEEKESFESIQEKAGRCKHGPPTDYPCHLCCHQKWVSTRRLDQPLVDRENGRGQGHIVHIGGSDQLSGDVQAKSKEKKREHSEETRGDKADILFDGITVGPKTKKANSEMNTAGKNYGFNVPPGVTITAGGPLKSKTSYTPNDVVITPISAKEVTITTGVPFKSETSSASKSTPNDLVITPILRKEATITTGGPPNNSSTLKEVLITPMSTKEASLHEEEQKQLKEIVKKTNWAEVFRMSGVSVLGKPVPAPSEAEVTNGTFGQLRLGYYLTLLRILISGDC